MSEHSDAADTPIAREPRRFCSAPRAASMSSTRPTAAPGHRIAGRHRCSSDFEFSRDLSHIDAEVAHRARRRRFDSPRRQSNGMKQRPIVGVNMGKLGFLADISPAAFEHVVARSLCGPLPGRSII